MVNVPKAFPLEFRPAEIAAWIARTAYEDRSPAAVRTNMENRIP